MNNLVDITINNNSEGLDIILDKSLTLIELNNDEVSLVTIDDSSLISEIVNPEILITEVGCISTSSNTLLNNLVIGEIPQGLIDGINATFTTLNPFVPSSVEVYLNGIRQKIIEDYTTINNDTIQFMVSPTANENILIDYIIL